MRQIALDTETTGISTELGHRIIEIACVEIMDRKLTSARFHTYLNPQRAVDEGAFRVHGISSEFLQDKPLFKDVLADFLQFINGAEVIIHNAVFDVEFLNAELKYANCTRSFQDYCTVFDTLMFARKKHSGQRNHLDALCKRYGVDHSKRQLHGALLDAELLAFVYLAMTGGQTHLFTADELVDRPGHVHHSSIADTLTSRSPVVIADEVELARHAELVQFIVKTSGVNLWDDE